MTSPPPAAADRFRSILEIKRKHVELSDRVCEAVLAPGNPELIADFVRRAAATGVVLETRDERAAAQGLINYWNALLASERAARWEKEGRPAEGPEKADELPTLLAGYEPGEVTKEVARAAAWFETLPESRREVTRRVLLRLISLPTRGTKYLPHPVPSAELEAAADDPAAVEEVVAGLKDADVIRGEPDPAGGEVLGLASAPLPRLWKPYATWVDQRLRFRDMAEYWGEILDDALLIDGPLLRTAKTYHDLNTAEQEFISRSEEFARLAQEKAEERRKKLSRVRQQRNQAVVVVLMAVIVGLAASVVVYERQRRLVNQEAEVSKVRRGIGVRVQEERSGLEAKYLELYDTLAGGGKPSDRDRTLREFLALRKRVRDELNKAGGVITPGSFIGLKEFDRGGGSVCAVVRDKGSGQKYLLTAGYVLSRDSTPDGAAVYCPPLRREESDAGTRGAFAEGRRVGAYAKERSNRMYAMVKLDDGVEATNDIGRLVRELPPVMSAIDRIRSCDQERAISDSEKTSLPRLWLLGSASGISEQVPSLPPDFDGAARAEARLKFLDNIDGIITPRFAAPRDGGGPVYGSQRELVGMLYMSEVRCYDPDTDRSLTIPIDWIFEKANVELVPAP